MVLFSPEKYTLPVMMGALRGSQVAQNLGAMYLGIVSGDIMAIGAINAIQNQGLRVPEDISIIGFDDIEFAKYVTPALTTQ